MREIYEQHYDALYQYILYLTTDATIADDFVQETFIRFYKMKQVNEPKAVLFRIGRNLVYDHFRRKRLMKWLPLGKEDKLDPAPLPEEIIEKSQQAQNLYKALQTLKLSYRQVIVLRYIEELSVKEVAYVLKLSEVQVKNYTARGFKVLRERLGGNLDV